MTPSDSYITTVPIGPAALSSLVQAVADAQASDPFARVVVITDHRDVAQSVRHRLGAPGTVNVTVQTGRHLAKELSNPAGRQLPRLLEAQAVRHVAEADANRMGFDAAGCRRFYRSLATAFREMAERPDVADAAETGEPDDMSHLAERLYGDYRTEVGARGYYLPSELPHMAVAALNDHWGKGREPAVIYYLPRRLSVGDVELARALLERGKCRVIAGLVGDEGADSPVLELMELLGSQRAGAAANIPGADPLRQRAEAGSLSIVVAPDPEEEVRSVLRSIVADDQPFHRIAVIYRQDNPYASLLRQELDFANIPYSGVDYRRLADTPAGRLLQGLTDLAEELNGPGGTIDRERLIKWFTSTPVRWPREPRAGDDAPRSMTAPAAAWANLARNARASGTVEHWRGRLSAYLAQMEPKAEAVHGDDDDNPFMRRLRRQVAELLEFVERLAAALSNLSTASDGEWSSASQRLKTLSVTYRWVVAGESEEDLRRIDELVGGLSSLRGCLKRVQLVWTHEGREGGVGRSVGVWNDQLIPATSATENGNCGNPCYLRPSRAGGRSPTRDGRSSTPSATCCAPAAPGGCCPMTCRRGALCSITSAPGVGTELGSGPTTRCTPCCGRLRAGRPAPARPSSTASR